MAIVYIALILLGVVSLRLLFSSYRCLAFKLYNVAYPCTPEFYAELYHPVRDEYKSELSDGIPILIILAVIALVSYLNTFPLFQLLDNIKVLLL